MLAAKSCVAAVLGYSATDSRAAKVCKRHICNGCQGAKVPCTCQGKNLEKWYAKAKSPNTLYKISFIIGKLVPLCVYLGAIYSQAFDYGACCFSKATHLGHFLKPIFVQVFHEFIQP